MTSRWRCCSTSKRFHIWPCIESSHGTRWFMNGIIQIQFHIDHIEPATEFKADLLGVADFFEVKFSVQPDAGGLFSVNAGDDNAVAEIVGVDNQFPEYMRADAAPVVLVMDINGVLNGTPV